MAQFPPEQEDVVVVSSEPGGEDDRRFTLEQEPEDEVGLDTGSIRHEDDLVATMTERGYTLTMVGGGSRSDDVRRFYFRRTG